MAVLKPSEKYQVLLDIYSVMARDGFVVADGRKVENAFANQEAAMFRHELRRLFGKHSIASVMDYGAGAVSWEEKSVPEGGSLLNFLGRPEYHRFEPARDQPVKAVADAVTCFDVLEHVFLADVAYVLEDIFAHARHLVVLNIACFPARAQLPHGENAHITLRSPDWWLGAVDAISSGYPEVSACLFCSRRYGEPKLLREGSMAEITSRDGFSR